MSFECKYYLNGHCELRGRKCDPGERGCILNSTPYKMIGQEEKDDMDSHNNKKEPV